MTRSSATSSILLHRVKDQFVMLQNITNINLIAVVATPLQTIIVSEAARFRARKLHKCVRSGPPVLQQPILKCVAMGYFLKS